MAKIIKSFKIDLSSIAAAGTIRSFSITGDNGAIFSLEVKNELNEYYNFTTNTFAATHKRLKNKRIDGGVYTGSITFPAVGDPDQYDIYLYAESMHDTVHAKYSEVRFGDGSIDINSSTGSNSNLLKKVIYQYDDVTITLSAIDPNTAHSATNFSGMSVSTDTITVGRGNTVGKTAFSVGVTTATTKALQINRQPIASDLAAYATVLFGSGVKIPGEDIWTGAASTDTVDGAVAEGIKVVMDNNVATKMDVGDRITGTATTDTVDGTVTSGVKVVMDNNVATKMAVGDRITGNAALDAGIVTVAALNPDADNVKEFSMSEAVAIADGVTLTFNSELNRKEVTVVALNPDTDNVKEFSMSDTIALHDGMTLTFTSAKYYRWSLNSSHSIHKLSPGMKIVDADYSTTDTVIAPYEDTTTYTTEIHNEDGSIEEVTNTVTNVSIPALDPLGYKPTITNGLVTQQLGYITLADQIIDASSNNSMLFYAYGPDAIKTIHNTEIKLTDLKVELTKPITYTTGAVSDSTTIAVADREGTVQNVSSVSGIGVGVNNTDTVDGAVAIATKIVMDNNVAGHMRVGDIVTGVGIPNSSTVTVAALDPDGDNVKEFSVSESVTIADETTLTFKPQSLPVITSSTADGAGSWTVDVAQTLESGAILTVGGTGRTATITGNIEFVNVDDTNFTLRFDVNKFLTAS